MADRAFNPGEKEPVKAVILAAGSGRLAGDDTPMLLHPLGSKAIVDYVVENALRFVKPSKHRAALTLSELFRASAYKSLNC